MINKSYVLVTNIPCFVDSQGSRFLDPLWHKDLLLHLGYINRLVVACPRRELKNSQSQELKRVDDRAQIQFCDLPFTRSRSLALLLLPQTIHRLNQVINESQIVHCGVAGWPYPLGWIASRLARSKNKFLMTIVESAPWRMRKRSGIPFYGRFEASLYEILARYCVRGSDLSIFTQPEYMDSLLGSGTYNGYTIPASWIDDDKILSEQEFLTSWANKSLDGDFSTRFLFAGRLVKEKGLDVFTDAIAKLRSDDSKYEMDVMGEGALRSELMALSRQNLGSVQLRVLPSMRYDTAFFDHLQKYHAVIVPSLSDEQPRIIFDSFSQGVPVIGSDTAGIASCVQDGETGFLFRTGNAFELAQLCRRMIPLRSALKEVGLNCLHKARSLTHQKMHERRYEILLNAIGGSF